MKKFTLFLAIVVMAMASHSCMASKSSSSSSSSSSSEQTDLKSALGNLLGGKSSSSSSSTTTTSDDDSNSQSLLGSLLSGLVGNNTTVTVDKIVGTWNYSSPECRFTSESALAQAGGAVAANTVEQKLATIYSNINIKSGNTSFTFNEDNTCVMVLGGKTINGTFTLDSDTRELSMKSKTGLIKLNAQVYYSYTTLSLLFDADKLLSIVKMISTFTGQGSSTLSTVNSVLENYNGMMIGMNLQK